MARPTRAPHDLYSPERPTAVVLSGCGADGAYHAGVLRALHEAGVKIDLVAGRGVGVLGAIMFAADGASMLWDTTGFWSRPAVRRGYGFRWPYRAVTTTMGVCAAILGSPALLLLLAVLVWPIAFGLGLAGVETGALLARGFSELVRWSFSPSQLPTWLPRLTVLALGGLLAMLAGAAAWQAYRSPRTGEGSPLWRLLGAPFDSARLATLAAHAVRDLVAGSAGRAVGQERELSQRLVELLGANIGQPGHHDVLVTVHDVDARRDLVFGLLAGEAGRRQFPDGSGPSARRTEAFDLATIGHGLAFDVLRGALTVPAVSEPVWLRFPAESVWRGEVHRISDRPAAVGRLLEEAAAAGIEQVLVVTARPAASGPNALTPAAIDGRRRAGEWLAAEETAAIRDGVRFAEKFFHAVFVVRPDHNPVGPLDLAGAEDPSADRRVTLGDLQAQGYDDAHRLFIEPALGAAGERLGDRGR